MFLYAGVSVYDMCSHSFVRSYVFVVCDYVASGIVPFTLRSNDRVNAMSDLENTNRL